MKRILSTEINGDTDAYLDTTLYSDTDAPYVDCSDASANEAGGDFAVQSLSSSDFIIWESAWEFGSRSVKVNGTELVSGNVYDSGGAVSGVFVNGVYQIAQQRGFDNQIGIQEHLCYSSKLSDSDRLAIRQNIAAYYGITLA
jgi:hypothetical protein